MALGASLDLYFADCYGSTTFSRLVAVCCQMEDEYVSRVGSDLGGIRKLTRMPPYSLFGGQGGHQGNVRGCRDLQKFLNSKPMDSGVAGVNQM